MNNGYANNNNSQSGNRRTLVIGILALQGAFLEHKNHLLTLNSSLLDISIIPRFIKKCSDLDGIDGLILPGGESTSMRLINDELLKEIKSLSKSLPILGTCAGLILLANGITESSSFMGGLDVEVQRNYFGSQINSFQTKLEVTLGNDVSIVDAIFIRAPIIKSVGDGVKIICKYQDLIVGVEYSNLMAICFHPELTDDVQIHRYFIDKIIKNIK